MTAAQIAALLLAAATARRVQTGRQIAPALYAGTTVYLATHHAIRITARHLTRTC